MDPTLSILGGLAVVLRGVLVDTGVCMMLPFMETVLGGTGVIGGVMVGMNPPAPLPGSTFIHFIFNACTLKEEWIHLQSNQEVQC